MKQSTPVTLISNLLANLLVAAIGASAFILWSYGQDAYYVIVQEDELLEWTTFWAFIGAACVYLYVALRPDFNLNTGWFPVGLVLFCLFVALEEISWGQRIFGYRPPEYFLQFNFQQELNLHNVVEKQLRKLAVITVIFGYGVVLPLLGLIPTVRQLFGRIGILAPTPALIPAFLLTGIGQQWYPLKFTGEWTELMLGTCFLYAALAEARARTAAQTGASPSFAIHIAGAALVTLAAGMASTMATNQRRDADPGKATAARFELEALQRDFVNGNVRPRRCEINRRIFTFAERARQSILYEGEFANLTQQHLPEQRAAFFLDPWNYAYWVRGNCAADGRPTTIYLYSFGPNQRRESTRWEIRGDDIAVVVRGMVDDFRTPVADTNQRAAQGSLRPRIDGSLEITATGKSPSIKMQHVVDRLAQ